MLHITASICAGLCQYASRVTEWICNSCTDCLIYWSAIMLPPNFGKAKYTASQKQSKISQRRSIWKETSSHVAAIRKRWPRKGMQGNRNQHEDIFQERKGLTRKEDIFTLRTDIKKRSWADTKEKSGSASKVESDMFRSCTIGYIGQPLLCYRTFTFSCLRSSL